ncbi:hypothetical protein IWQ55_006584 [Labrenzia sp. EL_208]|nr:hypothetical protein [Labrenzia sp. EL_132]MBG6233342.1 hypothetical protein [Labrenzia sp. EL_208]
MVSKTNKASLLVLLVLLLSWVWISIGGLPSNNDMGQPGFTYACDMIWIYQCFF